MNGLTFDEAAHAYALDGSPLPSVTQILAGLASYGQPIVRRDGWTEAARERGSDVHAAIHLLTLGKLDRSSLTEEIAPYIVAYEQFLRESFFEPMVVETRMASRVHRFAGTLDAVGMRDGCMTLVDVKSGAYSPWHDLQLAAYAILLEENDFGRVEDALVLQLRGGDKPRYWMHPIRRSLEIAKTEFLACRRVHALCGDPAPETEQKEAENHGHDDAFSDDCPY